MARWSNRAYWDNRRVLYHWTISYAFTVYTFTNTIKLFHLLISAFFLNFSLVLWVTECTTHSFFTVAFPLGGSRGSLPRMPRNTSQFSAIFQAPLTSHQDGTKVGRRCPYGTWPMDDLWAAFSWVGPEDDSPILGHSGHVAEPAAEIYFSEKWFNIQSFINFTWDSSHSTITQIHDHRWGSGQRPI